MNNEDFLQNYQKEYTIKVINEINNEINEIKERMIKIEKETKSDLPCIGNLNFHIDFIEKNLKNLKDITKYKT